jgi:hypothetical protein
VHARGARRRRVPADRRHHLRALRTTKRRANDERERHRPLGRLPWGRHQRRPRRCTRPTSASRSTRRWTSLARAPTSSS